MSICAFVSYFHLFHLFSADFAAILRNCSFETASARSLCSFQGASTRDLVEVYQRSTSNLIELHQSPTDSPTNSPKSLLDITSVYATAERLLGVQAISHILLLSTAAVSKSSTCLAAYEWHSPVWSRSVEFPLARVWTSSLLQTVVELCD